jgi:hypothetical protein
LSTDVSEVRAPSIIRAIIDLMMEAARTSETSVNNYFTWQYIPEDKSELQTIYMLSGKGNYFNLLKPNGNYMYQLL